MQQVRVAVVGAGYMGGLHAVKYSVRSDVNLVAVVDARRARAAELADRLACRGFGTVEELLGNGKIDAVTIATPTATHATIARELIEAKIHCLVEKPLAHSSAAATDLAILAERAGVVLMPGHIERFNPAVRAVLERAPSISYINAYRVGPMSFRSIDTDVVLDVMTHDIDIALHLTRSSAAEVDVVRAIVAPEGVQDVAKVELKFGLATADLVASRLAIARRRKMRIFAADGYFSIDCSRRTAIWLDRDKYAEGMRELRLHQEMGRDVASDVIFAAVRAEQIVDPQRHGNDPLEEEQSHFLRLVRGEKVDPLLTATDGVRVLRIGEAILNTVTSRSELPHGIPFRI